MKKLLYIFVLISCVVSAQTFQGVRFSQPPVTGGTSGSAGLTWDETFDLDYLATETWGLNRSVGKTKLITAGDGLLLIEGGGPVNNYGTDFNPQGIYRIIAGDFTATTKFSFAPTENYQTAGICVANGSGQDWMMVCKSMALAGRRDTVAGTSYDGTFSAFTATETIYLKVTRVGTTLAGYYGINGTDWTTAVNSSTKFTPHASDSAVLWLFNIHTTNGGVATATFDYFTVTRP